MEESICKVDNWIVEGSSTVFVFSCPGQAELLKGRVCAGKTGENLDALIRAIQSLQSDQNTVGDYFPHVDRYAYSILNASTTVHFGAKTGDTQATAGEIDAGIGQFIADVKRCKPALVILFGGKAQTAWRLANRVESLASGALVIGDKSIRHLGFQSLNSMDIKVTPEEKEQGIKKSQKAIAAIAQSIVERLPKRS